jgi:glyoxylase-like metal-dependent hydrolase (beta-lactamase superfamily II)
MAASERISVRRITTGFVREKRASRGGLRYLVDDWEDAALPVNANLVEHPGGRCLFDTGQTAAAAHPGYLPRWHPFLRLARFELDEGDEAGVQLQASGVPPASVDHVVLSHLHTDHVGGVGAFPDADVVAGGLEWRRAQGVGGRLRGYFPGRWPSAVRPRLVTPDGPAVGPFPASYDLVGDGSLTIVPTPGHTPGHLSMVVRGATRAWFLAGDLVRDPADLADRAPAIARWCDAERVEVLTAHDQADPGAVVHAAERNPPTRYFGGSR